MEPKVCSLELAKRLCELGEKQEGLWWWREQRGQSHIVPKHTRDFAITDPRQKEANFFSAPTVAELGERLPRGYLTVFGGESWQCFKILDVRSVPIDFELLEIKADTEANARAKIRIHLLENKQGG